jgi:uncharacterized membrane protein
MLGMLIVVGFIVLAMAYAIVKDFASMAREQRAIEAEYKRICNNSIIDNEWLSESTNKAFEALKEGR